MARSRSEAFTFTWKIENFSMCPQQPGEVIESPAFGVEWLENTEWKLVLYPRGYTSHSQNYLCFVFTISQKGNNKKFQYSLAVLSTRGDKDIARDIRSGPFESELQFKFPELCTREKIFENNSELLPNDTLTLRCRISRCVEDHENKEHVPEVLKTDCWNLRPQRYNYSFTTRVGVSRTSFLWPIKAIDELSCDMKLSVSVPSVLKSDHSFDLSLHLKEDAEGGRSVHIEILKKDPKGDFVRCHIRTVGAPKGVEFRVKDEHYFESGKTTQAWVFPTFLNIKDLREGYFQHTDGALYLQCEFSISTKGNVLDTVQINESFPPNVQEGRISRYLTKNFEKLYLDGELVDLTLRAGHREFKVHKLILSAASDVFRRMLESKFKEKNSGIVDIHDLDPDTVERLLKYLYTEELPEMNAEDARKLYSAADMYNLGTLKYRLSTRLTAILSVDTICETLILAELHQDEELMTSIVDYVDKSSNEVFHSNVWKDFTETHGDLAARIMLQFITRK